MMIYGEINAENLPLAAELYKNVFNRSPWNDQWTLQSAYERLDQMLNCRGFLGMYSEENGKIVGIILGNEEIWYSGIHFHIKEFCIDTDFQGKGVGTNLLNVFIQTLKSKGITKLWLNTEKGGKTEAFYEKRGFYTYDKMVMMVKKI